MTELLPIQGLYAIEVPEDAEPGEWKIFNVDGNSYLNGITSDGEMYAGLDPLPPGSYEILFTTKNCTEGQAGSVVECISMGGFGRSGEEWKDYNGSNLFRTATEALQSLLRSHNLTANNFLLIKRLP